MKLSIGLITNRKEPKIDWLIDSLSPQIKEGDDIELIVVGGDKPERWVQFVGDAKFIGFRISPMPSAYSGRFRKTKEDWWDKCTSLNSFFCAATHPNIVCLDDRAVLLPGWLDTVRKHEGRVFCGAYEKRKGMKVENGVIVHGGIITGTDGRLDQLNKAGYSIPFNCRGEWLFGCLWGCPLEFVLEINGVDTRTSALSFEDVLTGLALNNNGHGIVYDPRAMMIEDRTPEESGVTRRSSKERHPHDHTDKAHVLLNEYRNGLKKSPNPFDIRAVRDYFQRTGYWLGYPLPDKDWFDGQPLSELGDARYEQQR